jgi:hypothetical protein
VQLFLLQRDEGKRGKCGREPDVWRGVFRKRFGDGKVEPGVEGWLRSVEGERKQFADFPEMTKWDGDLKFSSGGGGGSGGR